MGFILTLAYIILTIISPEQFGPEWANYHALVYLAALTALASLPSVATHTNLQSSVQTYLMAGFIIAIGVSQVANGWFGGAVQSWLVFLPSAAVYFFIVANVTSYRRLKIVIVICILSCLILVGEGLYGYYFGGVFGETFVMNFHYAGQEQVVTQIPRLRGIGFLNDPNDFAQILLICVPLLFILWRRGQAIMNATLVLLPVGVLLWATYLTHSRGALIGLAVLGLMVARSRLGTAPSIVLTGVLAMGLLAVDFTGGRGISAAEGADRLEAWSTGLELFKHAPLFGVGFGNFTNFNEITAHNSFVLCLAELGIVGTTLWLGMLIVTTMRLNTVLATTKESEPVFRQAEPPRLEAEAASETVRDLALYTNAPLSPGEDRRTMLSAEGDMANLPANEQRTTLESEEYHHNTQFDGMAVLDVSFPLADGTTPFAPHIAEKETVDLTHVPTSWLAIIRLALISFIATSWFLSRSYSTTMYLILGIATAAIAIEDPSIETHDRRRWMPITLTAEAAGIIFVYLVVRLRH